MVILHVANCVLRSYFGRQDVKQLELSQLIYLKTFSLHNELYQKPVYFWFYQELITKSLQVPVESICPCIPSGLPAIGQLSRNIMHLSISGAINPSLKLIAYQLAW